MYHNADHRVRGGTRAPTGAGHPATKSRVDGLGMFWILVLLFDAALASLHCVKVGLPVYMYVCVTGLSYSR
jgi:hypothetical protein